VKKYVFDTHALIGYAQARRLGRAAARAIREIDGGRAAAWIPAVVPVELALLQERGRTVVGVAELEATLARNPAIRLLPLDLAQAREFALLPTFRDPFDRMIVAAARSVPAPLITADGHITDSGLVEVVWD
jgi:PIN domain nuclease of toxin-antitoxin system